MNTITDKFPYKKSENNPNEEDCFWDIKHQIDIEMLSSSLPNGSGLEEDNLFSGSYLEHQHKSTLQPSFKQWEGTIISIEDNNCFLARIQEISGARVQRIVRFDKRNVDFVNHELFAEGASFYWKIGLFYNSRRMAVKRSEIRFRLLPPPNPMLIKSAGKDLKRLLDTLSWVD